MNLGSDEYVYYLDCADGFMRAHFKRVQFVICQIIPQLTFFLFRERGVKGGRERGREMLM